VPLMASIAAAAIRSIGEWCPQSLANMAWACASLDLMNLPLLQAIAAQSISKMGEFNPQELMNMSWAFATLSVFNRTLMEAISAAAIRKIGEFNPHDLSGLAWSFSIMGYRNVPLMAALSAAAITRITEFKPQDLANMAWSFANLGFQDEPLLTAISAAAIASMSDFRPQDLGNTFWAFAKLEIAPGEALKDAISSASLRLIAELEPQNLAMTAWAFASLGIVHETLMAAISAASLRTITQFATHDLANLLWSYPALELEVTCPLFPRVREILVDRVPAEASAALARLSTGTVTSFFAAEVSEFTNALLEFAWSFAFSDNEMGDLVVVIRSSLLAIARAMDDKGVQLPPALSPAPQAPAGPTNWEGMELPTIVLDLPGIVAVLKPPHWEVDARAGGSPIPSSECGAPLLSNFLRWNYPLDKFPLVHCNEQQYGIIHRLDTPSSGLILAGKNFVGYYTLRWQQDTYELGREYIVLCHGRMPWGPRVINAKIKTSKAMPVSSQVSEDGRPAWTQVEPMCVVRREDGAEHTLVAIMIRTGRTHQIRVHLKHIGHPTVTDGKYTDQVLYGSDRSWCPRNFLHRHRLTFQDTESILREAVAPLPEDLLVVLRTLHPVDARSSAVFQRLLDGWVPNAGLM